MRPKMRIAVLNSHPIQYFAPLYAYLNRTPDLEVTALYLSDISLRGGKDEGFGREVKWDVDLLAGYPSIFLGWRANKRVPKGFWSLVVPRVWSEVRSGHYDVLWLHGHNYAANLIALLAARSVGIPVLMRGETHLGLSRQGLKALVRRPLMKALYSQCDRLLAIGSANMAFYRAMGVRKEKLFVVPYAVDNDRFTQAAALNSDQKAEVRRRYGIPLTRPAILFAAKFTARKRPMDVLKAAQRLVAENGLEFTLIMAGSGELEAELRAFCTKHSLDNVVFTGFMNQSQLPALYAASDVFVLPSEQEPWGLAVNETMCAGLPVVISRELGCAADLVREGVNGFTPEAGDIDALTGAIRRVIQDDELRERQGEASRARISEWSYQQCLDGLRAALGGLNLDKRAPARALKASRP